TEPASAERRSRKRRRGAAVVQSQIAQSDQVRRRSTMPRTILALVVTALVAVPAAFAGPSQQYGPHDPWYAYGVPLTPSRQLDARHQVLIQNLRAQSAKQTAPTLTTDTLAPVGGSERTPAVRFVTDTLAPGGGGTTTVVSTKDGFDWGDAGIGAAGAIGALLLASAAGVAMRRSRKLAF